MFCFQEGEYIEMDYRDLESFILGELDDKDSLFQPRDKSTTNNRNHNNNNKILTVRDSNQNLYSVKNVTESLTTTPQPCTVISRNPNGDIKLKLTEHDLGDERIPSAVDFFTSVIKETSSAVISVPQPYVERDASDDFFAIKSPVHRISTAAENAAVDRYQEPTNNAMFRKDPTVDINNSSGSADDVFSKDSTTDFFHSSSSSHEDFSITTEPTTEINETLEQALFR